MMDENHGDGEMEGIHIHSDEPDVIPQSPPVGPISPASPPHILSTDWSRAYSSEFTILGNEYLNARELQPLRHVNCSYLSSGKAPTLLALKQHAQSLTNLIRKISTSTSFGGVDGWLDGSVSNKNEAFDWLNDLSVPYENDDDVHHLPLRMLQNSIAYEDEVVGVTHACPLFEVPDHGPYSTDGDASPCLNEGALLEHANRCLEIIDELRDHCGGLLSVLDPDKFQREEGRVTEARLTLLGQWLMYQQHQASRMRELEISYANALDALAAEATIPFEMRVNHISPNYGDPGHSKFQSRYILGHINDAVTKQIHDLLDQKEKQVQENDEEAFAQGVSGIDMWDGQYSRGLVWIDEPTRYCRLKNIGSKSPIFIIPISDKHNGTQATRRLEKRPARLEVVRRDAARELGNAWKLRTDLEAATEQINRLVQERDIYKKELEPLKQKNKDLEAQRDALQREKETGFPRQRTGYGYQPYNWSPPWARPQ